MNNYPLTADESFELENILDENKSAVFRKSIYFGLVILVISLVPVGWLPKRRASRSSTLDPNLSMIESMGFVTWLIIFLVLVAGCAYLMMLDKKIFALKKDIQEQEGMELTVTVTRMVQEDDFYCMFVSNDTVNNLKVVLDDYHYASFHVGQQTKIWVFKNSKVLISRMEYAS